ncbi:hypothetical protein AN963_01220 [Brevibacillus choshinensis]|uniref:Uncharacterized protein n=1 Tax=Brevibacillus choshinensis TaxID=54911 RepID=A0ABR5NAQ1_BRECH|nr:hypothetical protein [Brevibacillus choshinensis]KQL48461.1 hypothetical protein AN963_01220 [Brevibacillus choshinensis]
MSVGGFQSGFHARKVPRSEVKWESFLICSHGCEEVIQLISHVSGEVEFELCHMEAERMGNVLLEAARSKRK